MIFCAAGHDFCGTVRRGTAEHNKHVSLFVASAYLSFVSGMHFLLVGQEWNIVPIFQQVHYRVALVQFRLMGSSILLHRAAVLHVAVIGNASLVQHTAGYAGS